MLIGDPRRDALMALFFAGLDNLAHLGDDDVRWRGPVSLPLLHKLLGRLHRALVRIGEQVIYFFKGKVGCLGIAEVDQRDKGQVRTHEDEVGFPLQAIDDDRRNHDDEEVLSSSTTISMDFGGPHRGLLIWRKM